MIGYMEMPAGFAYRDVFIKGQPQHQMLDSFRIRHPSMSTGRRAKIFAPFDALAGFDDAIAAKEVIYEFKRELDDEDKEELDRRLGILHRLTRNGKLARENRVRVTITCFVPCEDSNSFAYGGQYRTVSGICQRIGMHSMRVDNMEIPFDNIVSIEADDTRLFEESWAE